MVASSAVILVCTSGSKQTNGEAARPKGRSRSFVLLLWNDNKRCLRALPTLMVTVSVTFLRFKTVNCLAINTSSSFEQFCFVRKSELGTVSSLKTPNRRYCRQFPSFKCTFKNFLLIITWSFIINYRIRAMYIHDWSRVWAGSRKSRMNLIYKFRC